MITKLNSIILILILFTLSLSFVNSLEIYVENGEFSFNNNVNNDKWFYVNYTKLENSIDAKWQISYLYPDGTQGGVPNSTLFFQNLTIPSNCFDAEIDELNLRMAYMGYGSTHRIDYECWNGSTYLNLHNRSYGDLGFGFSSGGDLDSGLIAIDESWTSNKSIQAYQTFYYQGCNMETFGTCWREGGYSITSIMYSHGLVEESVIFDVEEIISPPVNNVTTLNDVECAEDDSLCNATASLGAGLGVFFKWILMPLMILIITVMFVAVITVLLKALTETISKSIKFKK